MTKLEWGMESSNSSDEFTSFHVIVNSGQILTG